MSRDRAKDFKKGVDHEASREKRHEASVTLRRDRTAEDLRTRREQREGAADLPQDWRLVLKDSDSFVREKMYRDKMEELCLALDKIAPKVAEDLSMDDDRQKAIAAIIDQIERVLRENYSVVDMLFPAGIVAVVPCLAIRIDKINVDLLIAALSLVNLLSGGMRYGENVALVKAHAPELVVGWLTMDDEVIRPMAFETLANLCLDGDIGRNAVLACDVYPLAQRAMAQELSDDVAHAAANFVACTVTASPPPPIGMCQQALTLLVPAIGGESIELLKCCMWAVRAMFRSGLASHTQLAMVMVSPERMVAIFRLMCQPVPTATLREAAEMALVALTVIASAVSHTDAYTAALVEAGLLIRLAEVMRRGRAIDISHAMLLAANLTCTNAPQGAMVKMQADAGIFSAAKALGPGCVFEVRRNRALLFTMAAAAATVEQLQMLLDEDLVFHIADALALPDTALAQTMIRDYRTIIERFAVSKPLEYVNPAVARAHDHDLPDILWDIVHSTLNRELEKAASTMLAQYFPDCKDVDASDVPPANPSGAPLQMQEMEIPGPEVPTGPDAERAFFIQFNRDLTQFAPTPVVVDAMKE